MAESSTRGRGSRWNRVMTRVRSLTQLNQGRDSRGSRTYYERDHLPLESLQNFLEPRLRTGGNLLRTGLGNIDSAREKAVTVVWMLLAEMSIRDVEGIRWTAAEELTKTEFLSLRDRHVRQRGGRSVDRDNVENHQSPFLQLNHRGETIVPRAPYAVTLSFLRLATRIPDETLRACLESVYPAYEILEEWD